MLTPDQKIIRIALRQHGAFTREQALAHGLTARQIDGRLARGLWLGVHRGVYAVAGSPFTFESTVLSAVLASGRGACASHTTAGMIWKLDEISSALVHVSIPGRPRRRVAGVVTHNPRILEARDMTRLGVIPVTTPARTLFDLAGVVEEPTLEDALDDAIRRGLVTTTALAKRLRLTEPRGRVGLPLLCQLVLERLGRPVTGSRLENIVRRAFEDAGLPPPIPQYRIFGPDGAFIAEVDFAYPDARLAIEVDGYEFHSSRKQWENDRLRQNEIVALGWFVLRTTKRQIREQPQGFVSLVWRRLTTLQGVIFGQNQARRRSGVS